MGMKDNIDYVNAIPEKPIRGMVKAGIVKAKRTGIIPPLPEKSGSTSVDSQVMSSNISKEESIANLVNKGLDGYMDSVNNQKDRVERAKAKAMMVKIKRGTLERPPMPVSSTPASAKTDSNSAGETREQQMERLINEGLNGNMDEINSLDDRVLRGKVKAAIVKAKRAANQ